MKLFKETLDEVSKTFRNVFLSLFIDFLPILGFIVVANKGKVYQATSVLMLLTIATTIYTYAKEKRLPYITLYVAFITIFFGSATLHRHNMTYLQLRDTLYDLSLFIVFSLGLLFRVSVLKISLHKLFTLTDESWNFMTKGWAVFFLVCAITNEYLRRAGTFEAWLNFKEFLVPMTILTAIGLYALAIYKEKKKLFESSAH